MIQLLCVLIFLSAGSYYDIKYRKIPLSLFLLSGTAALLFSLRRGEDGSCVLGLAVDSLQGILLLGIAFLTKEKIGYGDGLSVLITGWFCGGKSNLLLFASALFISTVYALCLIARKKGGSSSIPFLPFLLTAYLLVVSVDYLERIGI